MALATQCPHCHTTFRVAQDQLKLRAGLVRCGSCKEIFNGIEHLRPSGQPQAMPLFSPATPIPEKNAEPAAPAVPVPALANIPVPPAQPPAVAVPPAPQAAPALVAAPESAPQAAALQHAEVSVKPPEPVEKKEEPEPEFIDFFDLMKPADPLPAIAEPIVTGPPAAPEHALAAPPDAAPDQAPAADDPLQRMTLMILSDDVPPDQEAGAADAETGEQEESVLIPYPADYDPDKPDPIEAAIKDLKRKPKRSKKEQKERASRDENELPDPEEIDEPSFVKSSRRREQAGRTVRILMGLATFLLLVGALGQAAYIFRNQIAAHLPQTKPLLAQGCTYIGCSVGLPAQIDAVSIESSELQTLPANKDSFILTALLRNRSQTVQTWPNIELTLNDSNEKPIVRRVFAPREYLASTADQAKGIAPVSEQSIKLSFELTQLKASGYRVYLYYP